MSYQAALQQGDNQLIWLCVEGLYDLDKGLNVRDRERRALIERLLEWVLRVVPDVGFIFAAALMQLCHAWQCTHLYAAQMHREAARRTASNAPCAAGTNASGDE